MNAVTIYSLFFDDIRIICFTKDQDSYIYGVACFVFVLFALEIVLQSLVEETYFLQFFFWLDLVATISLLPDVGWIMETMQNTTTSKAASIAKTSRAARVTRIIRIVRIVRLVRIVKLYKQAKVNFLHIISMQLAEALSRDRDIKDLEAKVQAQEKEAREIEEKYKNSRKNSKKRSQDMQSDNG